MRGLSTADLLVVSAYLLAVAGMSAWFARRQATGEDYFLAGRRMHGWPLALSLVANQASAVSLVGAPAFVALQAGGGLVWSDPAAGAPADPLWRPVWPVLWSAGDLLTGPLRARVRRCADPQCGWMFLDTSRSRPRLWCSMADCGNRAKARRHYARKRGSGAPGRDPAMIGRS